MSLALGLLLSMVALVASVIALLARARSAPEGADGRVAALESQVRLLLDRVRALEEATDQARAPAAVLPTPAEAPAPEVVTAPVGPDPSFGVAPFGASARPSVSTSSPPLIPSRPSLGLEQRIGARWATGVGIVVILVAAALFLKWAFDNEYLGPAARVGVGVVGGLLMLVAGLLLHRRQDVPYLSEGLAGGGLGCLYLSLFAAHALYGLIGPAAAFTSMFGVTLLGTLVAVLSGRLSTAVLAVLGGLLTPVLLRVERPDERNLLAYLLVLDVLVLLVARFRTWPTLTQLAWGGSALLLLQALWDVTEAPWAVGLAVLYRLVSSDYGSRVSDDSVPVLVHEGVSWTFLTLAIPLALDVQWITLAWAVEGVMLLWLASRVPISVAAWGGLVALLLAFSRAVAFDSYWSADIVAVWNLTFVVHLLVAGALAVGGWLGGRITAEERFRPNPPLLQGALWVASVVTLAVLFWREPTGLWPATLLTFEIVVVAWLGRGSTSPAFVVAIPFLAVVLILRVLLADDNLARAAAGSLLNLPLLSRVGACLGMGLAGGFLVRAPGASARLVGRIVSGGAGLVLLFALSLAWTRYQGALESAARASGRRVVGDVGWRIQVGLSVLWTVYAALALAWGFARRTPAVRYAALALLGLTVFKVIAVDFSAAKTSLRILSFLVLGVVLLLVSLVYQKLLGRRI